jgi:hypothetical protein
MIVGGLEEIRVDEANNEIYVADNYLNGRIMVFSLDKFEFKRGWGAYGHKLTEITTKDEDRDYKPNGPMPKEFGGHLTFNFSNDGLVYMADRVANRIQVVDRQGNYKGRNSSSRPTRASAARPAAWRSRPTRTEVPVHSRTSRTTRSGSSIARRQGCGTLGSMGENGGQFFGLHMIATDSKGNIYTGEVFAGERVQRFVPPTARAARSSNSSTARGCKQRR